MANANPFQTAPAGPVGQNQKAFIIRSIDREAVAARFGHENPDEVSGYPRGTDAIGCHPGDVKS